MDVNLRKAARTGKVNELYRVIQRNGNVLRRVDEVEFIDTPLHIAAEEGCIEFAMEMMNLKPSFARKLNHQGLSPLHIAVRKGHKEMALRFLEIDKQLIRVRGKKGKTPLHYLCKVGNQLGLLDAFLEASPDCIQDVTIENRTALHIAIQNNRLDVLQLLIPTLKRKDYSREVLNRKDKDGNTALHIAAIYNQPKMLKLLLNCKADKHATNHVGLTALAVAQQHNIRENIAILQGFFIPVISNLKHKLEKQAVKYVIKASILVFQNMDNISADDRNALLVILGLLLTATYQATLSPPGGVWQGENTSKSKGSYDARVLGSSVMGQSEFFFFCIPTYLVFLVTLFLTLALLKTFPRNFRTALQVLLAFFAVSFDKSISCIAPTDITIRTLNIFSGILFILMVSMCFVNRVSKVSVLIVGCWIFLSFYNNYFQNITSITALGMGVGQGLALFFTLYDEFWKGTIFIVCFCLFASFVYTSNGFFTSIDLSYFVALIGCWLFLSLGRLCIMRCSQFCNTPL